MTATVGGRGEAPGRELPDTIETIPAGLAFWAEETPDAPAVLSCDGRVMTHAQLDAAVARVVHRLGALGIGREARVATSLRGGIEACVALLGVMTVGAAVPFNPLATRLELARDLGRLQLDLLVSDGSGDGPPAQAAAAIGLPVSKIDDLLAGGDVAAAGTAPPPAPGSVAAILHTSGTTGLPKRVVRDHRSFVVAARAARETTGLTPDDRALLVGGVYTNAGLSNMLFALLTGGSCVLAPGFDPARVPDWAAAYQPTWALLNATELNLILEEAMRTGRPCVAGPESRLRAIRAGSQAMTPGTAERAEAFFGAAVFEGYGMSEASNIAKSGPRLDDRRAGSCGRPLQGMVDLRILDDMDVEVPPGVTGAIVVRGPTVFSGYLDDPEANAAAFMPGGWFRTGDLGWMDEDGFLYLTGRKSDIINRGGENIAPAEIDQVLQGHPAIAEAAVFAIPDSRFGAELVAAVVPRAGVPLVAWELRVWMLERLSPSKTPRHVWFVEVLPRTASNKVQRGELARRWREARG